jgi:hypothetical protein
MILQSFIVGGTLVVCLWLLNLNHLWALVKHTKHIKHVFFKIDTDDNSTEGGAG